MLIPIIEIHDNYAHYQFKASYDHALQYQLEKTLFFLKQVEVGLDEQNRDLRWYISNKELMYSLESLINSLSTLTEYYHGWIIYSHVGTVEHKKIRYSAIRRDAHADKVIDRIFEYHLLGTLRRSTIDATAYREQCKQAFQKAYECLLIGAPYELYVLNNYMKHNMVAGEYAPKANFNAQQITVPYVHISRPNDQLLNQSVYKTLFTHKLTLDGRVESEQGDYFINVINTKSRRLCTVGGLPVYSINGIDYIPGNDTVGISMESIVEVSHGLLLSIAQTFAESAKNDQACTTLLNRLTQEISKRVPKTLSRLVDR